MYNPDTRKFENLLGSSIASHAAVAAAAAAAANAFNITHSQNRSTDWYSQLLRWDLNNILSSTTNTLLWNLDRDNCAATSSAAAALPNGIDNDGTTVHTSNNVTTNINNAIDHYYYNNNEDDDDNNDDDDEDDGDNELLAGGGSDQDEEHDEGYDLNDQTNYAQDQLDIKLSFHENTKTLQSEKNNHWNPFIEMEIFKGKSVCFLIFTIMDILHQKNIFLSMFSVKMLF